MLAGKALTLLASLVWLVCGAAATADDRDVSGQGAPWRGESATLMGASGGEHMWVVLPPSDHADTARGSGSRPRAGGQSGRSTRSSEWRLVHLHPSMVAGFRIAATLRTPPSAVAAAEDRLWMVFPADPARDSPGEVWSVRAVHNPALDAWFSEPADRFEIRAALPGPGRLAAFTASSLGPVALIQRPDGARTLVRLRGDGWIADEEAPPAPAWEAGDGAAPGSAKLLALGPSGTTLVLADGPAPQRVWTKQGRGPWLPMDAPLPGEAIGLLDAGGLLIAAVIDRGEVGGGREPSRASVLELYALRGERPLPLGQIDVPQAPWCLLGVGSGLRLLSQEGQRGALRLQAFDPRDDLTPVELQLAGHGDERARWMHVPILGFLALGSALLLLLAFTERLGAVVALAEGQRPAELSQRALGVMIDYLPAALIVWLVAGQRPLDLLTIPIWTTPLERAAGPLSAVLLSVLVAGVCEAFSGRSLGKLVVGSQVVAVPGAKLSALRCLLRALLKFLVLAMPLLGVFYLLNPQRRGLPDLLSGAVVVRADAGTKRAEG